MNLSPLLLNGFSLWVQKKYGMLWRIAVLRGSWRLFLN